MILQCASVLQRGDRDVCVSGGRVGPEVTEQIHDRAGAGVEMLQTSRACQCAAFYSKFARRCNKVVDIVLFRWICSSFQFFKTKASHDTRTSNKVSLIMFWMHK